MFDVQYNGTNAFLAAGSDNPLTTVLHAGDSFTYSLSATAGLGWTTIASGFLFPGFALPVGPSGVRTLSYQLDFINGATSLLTAAGTDTNAFTHLGVNFLSLPAGLVFDQFKLQGTLVSSSAANTVITSLLPYPGQSSEISHPDVFTFGEIGSAVPEPLSWLYMIGGFAALGFVMRRRPADIKSVRVRYF